MDHTEFQTGQSDPEQARPPVYAPSVEVLQGVPTKEHLPCYGLGYGWTLFILGFFLTLPWYIGAIMLIFVIRKKDYRERPGCFACLIGAVFTTIIIIVIVVKASSFIDSFSTTPYTDTYTYP